MAKFSKKNGNVSKIVTAGAAIAVVLLCGVGITYTVNNATHRDAETVKTPAGTGNAPTEIEDNRGLNVELGDVTKETGEADYYASERGDTLTAADIANMRNSIEKSVMEQVNGQYQAVVHGEKGDTGETGVKGNTGTKGAVGDDGATGEAGVIGGEGKSVYVKYSTAILPSQVTQDNMQTSPVNAHCMGVATGYTEPVTCKEYSWSLIEGNKTFIRYSTSETLEGINESNVHSYSAGAMYMGVCSAYVEPETYSDYTWTLIKGQSTFVKYSTALTLDAITDATLQDDVTDATRYMGVCSTNLDVAPTNASAYTWSSYTRYTMYMDVQGGQNVLHIVTNK